MARYAGKHKAPPKHKAQPVRRTPIATPSFTPTFAAVTCASVGVTGAVAGAAVLTGKLHDSPKTMVLSNIDLPGPLTSVKAARLKPTANPKAAQRFTSRTVGPTATATPTDPGIPATGEGVLDRTAAERRRAQERASRARERLESGSPREIGAFLAEQRGWGSDQFSCLDSLWTNESNWNVYATNPSSGAYGIPQALPGSKMAAYGSDWESNPATQIKWGLEYIAGRYGTPCGALSFWQANNWY